MSEDFVVKDRRHFASDGEQRDIKDGEADSQSSSVESQAAGQTNDTGRSEEAEMAKEPGDGPCAGQPPLPEVTFGAFVLSLSTSALMNLGELPDPATNETCRNLPIAKQNIDILGMIKEKTKGNLDNEEENFLTNLLYELRMKYVAAVKK